VIVGDFFASNRLKSAEAAPLAGLSARIVSLATCVEADDFLGQVPYQPLFDFACLEALDSGSTAFRGVAVSSSLLTASLGLSASGLEGFVVSFEPAASFSRALGGVVRTLFRDGPIK
jgi:hypothetical protein